jgi:hypothetical protein
MKNGHRGPIGRVPLTDSTSRNSRRFPRNSADVANPAGGTAEPQAGGSIQEFSLSGRELEASAALAAKVEFHCGELFPRVGFIVTNLAASSRAVVRFYNKRGTAEQ